MPRYFFHIRKDSHKPDTVGVELANTSAAHIEAARVMGKELSENPEAFWNDEEWHIEVTDDRGLILFTVFSSAVDAAVIRRSFSSPPQ